MRSENSLFGQLKNRNSEYIKRCDDLEKSGFECTYNKKKTPVKKVYLLDFFAILKYACLADREISPKEVSFITEIMSFSSEQAVKDNLEQSKKTFSADNTFVPAFLARVIDSELNNNPIINNPSWINSAQLIDFYEEVLNELAKADGIVHKEEQHRIGSLITKWRNSISKSGVDTSESDGIANEKENALLYRLSFVGQFSEYGNLHKAHIVISAKHRCIYYRILDEDQSFTELEDEYTFLFEFTYNKISWENKPFNAKVSKGNVIITGKYSIECPDKEHVQLVLHAMELSDCALKEKKVLYSPAKIYAEEYLGDAEIKHRYHISVDPTQSRDNEQYLNNFVFRIYDDYMDILASGYIGRAQYGLVDLNKDLPRDCNFRMDSFQKAKMKYVMNLKQNRVGQILGVCKQCGSKIIQDVVRQGGKSYDVITCENKSCNWGMTGTIINPKVLFEDVSYVNWDNNAIERDYYSVPCLGFERELGIDIKYKGSKLNSDSLHIIFYVDKKSRLLGDVSKLTLYYICESHGIRCIEIKLPDEKSYYSFGEFLVSALQCYDIDFRPRGNQISPLRSSNNHVERLSADELSSEYFYNIGLDSDRLSYYEKCFVIDNCINEKNWDCLVQINANESKWRQHRRYYHSLMCKELLEDITFIPDSPIDSDSNQLTVGRAHV